ncbi:hypothetical protein VTH82DRAFT_3622 [Thermothelomyces myriococcoides]
MPSPKPQRRLEARPHGRKQRRWTNPLMPLLTQAFHNYRKKQAGKPEQKWPEALEGYFLDALLLIPQMGRSKYNIDHRQQGRNQLIGKYLWLASCRDMGPGEKPSTLLLEIRGEKGRKRVSSHIQVVRNFFAAHRCLHFLFNPRQKDKDDKDNRPVEKVWLKNNPILIALSENRLPDQRPNYEYFAQILALNEQVQFRPRRCWIFVSHPDVLVNKDGSGYLSTTNTKLSSAEYPHLRRNLERETWAKEEQQHLLKGGLLHEFTKAICQVESGSVSDLARKWGSAFPSLQQRLRVITSSTTDRQCDILHLHTTLELKEKLSFPAGSSLSSWVEISIEQPHLLNHRWRVETHLVRPPELSYARNGSGEYSCQEEIYERHSEFAIEYQHQPGCDGSHSSSDSVRGQCDCLQRGCSGGALSVPFPVPFPATAWAQTLANCAEFPAHPFGENKRHERIWTVKRERDDKEEAGWRRRNSKEPTQMDLVPNIAMLQEIWSCPPPAMCHERESSEASSSEQGWTRRGLILWTFDTIHSVAKEGKERGKLQTASSGRTCWRFLTILDPSSEHHLEQVMVTDRRASVGEPRGGVSDSFVCVSRSRSRAAAVSPPLSHPQHGSASTNENLPPAWDNVSMGLGPLTPPPTMHAHSADADAISHAILPSAAAGKIEYELPYGLSSRGRLTTPPSTGPTDGSLAQPFNTAPVGSDMLPEAMTDPFLSGVGNSDDDDDAYNEGNNGTVYGWHNHVSALNPWSSSSDSGYTDANATLQEPQHHYAGAWSVGAHPPAVQSCCGSVRHRHYLLPESTGQHEWASSTRPDSVNPLDLWAPVIEARSPVAAETTLSSLSLTLSAEKPSEHHHRATSDASRDSNEEEEAVKRKEEGNEIEGHTRVYGRHVVPPAAGGSGGGGDDDDDIFLDMLSPIRRKWARESHDSGSDEEGRRWLGARN